MPTILENIAELNEKVSDILSAHQAISTAITNKGGIVNQGDKLSDFASDINTIPSGGGSTLIEKTITANGTYPAALDNADGFSTVIVNVSSGEEDYPDLT